jgi:RNA polymerase sigma-70 factor (ECF subfamily)
MPRIPSLDPSRLLRPPETALVLGLFTELELLRLKTLARWYGRGLPADVGWEDLLQEALTRVLIGTRRVPKGVKGVAFVAGVMRSVRSEHWRRSAKRGLEAACATAGPGEPMDCAPPPDDELIAQQALSAIARLFADDLQATAILHGLASGMTAQEIRLKSGMSETEYDSTRKRMRRVLLREGLRWHTE